MNRRKYVVDRKEVKKLIELYEYRDKFNEGTYHWEECNELIKQQIHTINKTTLEISY